MVLWGHKAELILESDTSSSGISIHLRLCRNEGEIFAASDEFAR
jgi:hypothetical protein